jgi:hypothetical protein
VRLLQELEFEIDEVRFDEMEGAFEIERQTVVGLHDKLDFQIATHQFLKEGQYTLKMHYILIKSISNYFYYFEARKL